MGVGVVLCLFAVGFTAMTPYIRNAGAFYSYVARGLGRPAGLGAALVALFSYNALQIGVFGAFGFFSASTMNDLLGIDLPWPVYAFAGIAVVWFLGFRSINFGAKVLAALLVAETAILVLLALRDPDQGRGARADPGLLRSLQRLHLEDERSVGPRRRGLHRLRGHRHLP